jgi:hypothetical protein
MIEFPKLVTLSFSINGGKTKYFNRNFLESLHISETLPSLKKLIVECTAVPTKRFSLRRKEKICRSRREL